MAALACCDAIRDHPSRWLMGQHIVNQIVLCTLLFFPQWYYEPRPYLWPTTFLVPYLHYHWLVYRQRQKLAEYIHDPQQRAQCETALVGCNRDILVFCLLVMFVMGGLGVLAVDQGWMSASAVTSLQLLIFFLALAFSVPVGIIRHVSRRQVRELTLAAMTVGCICLLVLVDVSLVSLAYVLCSVLFFLFSVVYWIYDLSQMYRPRLLRFFQSLARLEPRYIGVRNFNDTPMEESALWEFFGQVMACPQTEKLWWDFICETYNINIAMLYRELSCHLDRQTTPSEDKKFTEMLQASFLSDSAVFHIRVIPAAIRYQFEANLQNMNQACQRDSTETPLHLALSGLLDHLREYYALYLLPQFRLSDYGVLANALLRS